MQVQASLFTRDCLWHAEPPHLFREWPHASECVSCIPSSLLVCPPVSAPFFAVAAVKQTLQVALSGSKMPMSRRSGVLQGLPLVNTSARIEDI